MIDQAYRVQANELRTFIERVERLNAQKDEISDMQKDVMAEAKATGYDVAAIRKIISMRKKPRDTLAEEAAVLEMYSQALGM